MTKQEEPLSTPVPQEAVAAAASVDKSDDSYFTCHLIQPKQHPDDEATAAILPDEPSQSTTSLTRTYTPAMYLARRDKRKSSPAVLGLLGLGEEEEAKLSVHLSQHRNSIEAAMLLANFNRPQIKSTPELEKKTTWKDTMSVDSNPDRKTTSYSYWDDAVQVTRQRRYSFNGKMSWNTMSKEFLDQASLLQELKVKPIKPPSTTSSLTSSPLSSPHIRSTTWYSESMEQHHQPQHSHQQLYPLHHHHQQQQQQHYPIQHPHQPFPHPHMQPHSAVYHPMYSPGHPLANNNSSNNNNNDQSQQQQQQQQQGLPFPPPPPGYYPYAYHQSQQPYYFPGKLPLLSNGTDSNNNNGTNGNNSGNNSGLIIHPYHPPPPHPSMAPHLHPLHPAQQHHHHQHHQHLQHLQQSHAMAAAATAAPPVKPKRKRRDQADDEENLGHVMPGDADFPDMAERDVEAARNDVEARPRRQKLRYLGDMYTPQWVRYNGQSKEGLCDTCKPGKWLQLKNSAFWYHKQFFHGISSVSGAEFMKPMDTRWVDQDIVEGLCHQCQQWVSVSNVKRKNSVLWYRHAHKCHVYHKPKNGSPKRR
ncbi:unnamed protein product [Absidia cylindrospora]